MEFSIREMAGEDDAIWVQMRLALWPGNSREAHADGIAGLLRDPDAWGFIAETAAREPAGFAELSIRKYANGCDSQPVPFLEGIWVAPQFRRQGAGARLIAHGFSEIGSDANIENTGSHAAHARWGFSETERVVYFRKVLRATDECAGHQGE